MNLDASIMEPAMPPYLHKWPPWKRDDLTIATESSCGVQVVLIGGT